MARLRRPLALVLLIFCFAGLCAGCLEGTPLDEYSYVISIGVDAGLTRRYYVSFLIQLESSSQQSGAGQGVMVLAAEGDSLFEAAAVARAGVADELGFMRTNYIAFSEDVAKTQAMSDFLGASLNELGIRRSVKLFVVLGSCNEYFKGLNSPTEPSVTKRQMSLFKSYTDSGVIPIANLALYREAASGGRFDVMLPTGSVDTSNESYTGVDSGEGTDGATGAGTTAGVNRDGGLKSYPWGCAVFNGAALAGALNGADTQLLLMMNGQFGSGLVYYKNDHSEYVFALEALAKAKVRLELGDAPKADVTVTMTGRVESDTAGDIVHIWESELKREFEAHLEAEMARVFQICRDLDSDVLGLGRYASMEFRTTRAWEEYGWKERYKNAEATFHVHVKPENTLITESRG